MFLFFMKKLMKPQYNQQKFLKYENDNKNLLITS